MNTILHDSCSCVTKQYFPSTHLAKLIRALWPPLRAAPLSPTNVKSPLGNIFKSGFKAHTDIVTQIQTTYEELEAKNLMSAIYHLCLVARQGRLKAALTICTKVLPKYSKKSEHVCQYLSDPFCFSPTLHIKFLVKNPWKQS